VIGIDLAALLSLVVQFRDKMKHKI
jgi:hypothetical protein